MMPPCKGTTLFWDLQYGVERILTKQQLEDVSELASFEGGLYGTKKDNRMRTCNMFILTSHYEGMPMGILEAFSYAVPCIVTPGSNMAEEISRSSAGWVCELSAESIADTIERACIKYRKNPQMYHTNACNEAAFYNWNQIAKKSIEELSKLI